MCVAHTTNAQKQRTEKSEHTQQLVIAQEKTIEFEIWTIQKDDDFGYNEEFPV